MQLRTFFWRAPHMKPDIERHVRGGSTSLVVQFLQEMRDPGSEQRNPREIPWNLEEKNTGVEKSIWTWLWSPKLKKSGSEKSDQNRFFHILAQFSTLLTWNMSIRRISFEAAESQLFKAVKIFENAPLVQKLCLFLWGQWVSGSLPPPRIVIR